MERSRADSLIISAPVSALEEKDCFWACLWTIRYSPILHFREVERKYPLVNYKGVHIAGNVKAENVRTGPHAG